MRLLKWCRYCRRTRSVRDFDGHAVNKDGIPAACRECLERRPELARPDPDKLKRWHA